MSDPNTPRDHFPQVLPSSATEHDACPEADLLWARLAAFISTKADQSQRVYRSVLLEWCRFLGAEPPSAEARSVFCAATDLHAMAYQTWLKDRPGQRARDSSSGSSGQPELPAQRKATRRRLDGMQSTHTAATIAKKMTILRRLYRVVIDAGLGVMQNPFSSDRVTPPSRRSGQKRPTEMVDFALVTAIVQAPDISTAKGIRDRAILSLLFGAGLRRSEVTGLRLRDVRRSSAGTPFVRLRATKSGRDADQALPDWAADHVDALVAQRRASGARDGDFLCVSFQGQGGISETHQQLSTHGVYLLFKHYCALVGAGPHVSPHSARATAITRLLEAGISYREVQEFSRHSSVQMVEAYDKRRLGVEQNPARILDYSKKAK